MSTIAEQVSRHVEAVAGHSRAETMAAFSREQAALAAAGAPGGVLEIGSTMPDTELLDVHGKRTTLYRTIGDRPAVVVLYRGAWCPYCNITLRTYQEQLLPALRDRGADLVAVSPQSPDGSLTMQEKNALAFEVLSDRGNTLARALGVLTKPSDEARAAQLELGLDLTAVNADGTIEVPMPTTAIIDRARVLRWIDVHPDYSTRSEAAEILQALDSMD